MNNYNKIFTIPNIMSMFRLLLIPVVCALFFAGYYVWSLAVLLFSALTDIADGIIARKFNMVSHVGRILDPVADKLTQLCILICLGTKFPFAIFPACVLALKEVFQGIIGIAFVKETKSTLNSEWHGKLATAFIYATMAAHILFSEMSITVSIILNFLCVALMILSLILYIYRYKKLVREFFLEEEDESENKEQ